MVIYRVIEDTYDEDQEFELYYSDKEAARLDASRIASHLEIPVILQEIELNIPLNPDLLKKGRVSVVLIDEFLEKGEICNIRDIEHFGRKKD